MKRRESLVVIAALISGCAFIGNDSGPKTETPSETRTAEPPDSEYETVVDLQEEGADPTGEKRIDPLLKEYAGPDTKLKLPEGRYLVEGPVFRDLEHFALVGENATLVPEETGANIFLSFKEASDLHIEGFTVDQTSSDRCGWMDIRCVGGENVIRDITLDGFIDLEERTNGFTLLCEGAKTDLTLQNIDLSDGARFGAGMYIFPQRSFFDPTRQPGSITIRDCHMVGWGKEGLYGSPHGGPLSIIGGRYKNNAIVQVRVGGGNADNETTVRNTTVVVDEPPDHIATSRNGNFRGIWCEEGDLATIEGCTVDIKDTGKGYSQGGIIVSNQFGRATVRDTTIRTDEDVPALRIKTPATEFTEDSMPSLDQLPESWEVKCSSVQIEGNSGTGAAINLRDRDNCLFENLSINQTNGTRNGLLSVGSMSTQIKGGTWVTAGYPIMVGPTGKSSSQSHVLCLQGQQEIKSMQFDGNNLNLTQSSETAGQTCIPPSVLPDSDSEQISYIGLTEVNSRGPFGHPVQASWDGSNLIRL